MFFSKFISTEGISLPLVDKIPLFSKHQVYTGVSMEVST